MRSLANHPVPHAVLGAPTSKKKKKHQDRSFIFLNG
jgi:hypothetical protein